MTASIGRIGAGNLMYHLGEINDPTVGYYADGNEIIRIGTLAEAIGVPVHPNQSEVKNVLLGRSADGTQALRERDTKVKAFDCTFSPQKDVSVVFALGDERTRLIVLDALDVSRGDGIDYLESYAVGARRGAGGLTRVDGDGLIGFAITHTVSRNLDPQLHSHVLIANMTRGPDGRWTALNGRLLYEHARTAGFIFQATLRAELTERLGIVWGDVEKGVAPIVGMDRHLVREFSTRRTQILAALDRNGLHSAESARLATLTTRPPKGPEPTEYDLRAAWARRAEPWLDSFRRLPMEPRKALLSVTDKAIATTVTKENATFDRRAVTQAIAAAARDGARLPQIEYRVAQFLHSAYAIQLQPERWTTPEMLALEQRAVDNTRDMQHRAIGLVQVEVIDHVIAARPSLGADQRRVIDHVATSGHGVDVISGWAGSGKTFTADAIRAVYERSGYTVVGAAPSARAAAELQSGAGIPSTTIDRLLIDINRERTRLMPTTIVVIDEAAMVDTRRLAALLEHTNRAHAKTILIGDTRQLPSVDAGGLFSALSKRLGAVELNENRRQRDPSERAAMLDLRNGHIERAIERLHRNGNVITSDNADHLRDGLVADWYEAQRSGAKVLMVAPRRAMVDDLNDRARALLLADRSLGEPLLRIEDVDYRVGDSIVALRNDRKIGVHNGDRATVRALTTDGLVVERADRTTTTLPLAYLEAGHLTHGYATTIHKAQGVTVDQVFVLGDDTYAHEHGYTALTRGRDANRVYLVAPEPPEPTREHVTAGQMAEELNPVDAFMKSLHRSAAKTAAIDHAVDPRMPELAR